MWGLSKLLLPLPRRWGIPDVHWVEHWWMIDECGPDGAKAASFWTNLWEGTWGPRRLRSVLGVAGRAWEAHANREGLATRDLRIAPSHVCFVSNYMAQLHREAGFAFPSSEVIHGGVPTAKFRATVRARAEADPLQLLYAGQISADRGLHTIVEALGRLDPDQRSRMMLRVAGQGPPDYLIRVRTLVDRLGLTDRVAFLGKVSHDQMPALYRQHDVLVFSSSRPEGLPLTMIEAMLSGCAVVTTGSGGAREVADMAQLPTFPANDAASLAGWLGRFLRDAGEVHRIAAHGQQVALRHFGFDRMVDRFVESLATLHAEHARRVSIPLASRGRAERSVTAQ
jgi:glycosyltransferase involved in cell wall biosynthesis